MVSAIRKTLPGPAYHSEETWELDKDTLAVSLFPDAERPPMDALEAEAAHVAQASGLSEVKVRVA